MCSSNKKTISKDDLSFTAQEMSAIIKLAGAMTGADGNVHPNETTMIAQEALRFGVGSDDIELITSNSSKMEATKAMACIAAMNEAQKRYVCAYLGTLMAIDGDIDEKEMALWKLVSTICDLPTMNVVDAIHYMSN